MRPCSRRPACPADEAAVRAGTPAALDPDLLRISIAGHRVFDGSAGGPVAFDRAAAREAMDGARGRLRAWTSVSATGRGEAFGCDLTEAYVHRELGIHDVSEILVVKLGGTTIADQIAGARGSGRGRAATSRGPGPWRRQAHHRMARAPRRPVQFEGGLRVTDAQSLEVAAAVLRGVVNCELVAGLRDLGVDAVGLSGVDGGLLIAERIPKLGLVASVVGLRRDLLDAILVGGQVPVVAPLARDADGIVCNVNADDVAAGIAAGLGARQLVLLTDVDGVRDADGHRLDALTVGRGGGAHRLGRHRRRDGAQGPRRARGARLGRRRGDHRRLVRPGGARTRAQRPDLRDAHHREPGGPRRAA